MTYTEDRETFERDMMRPPHLARMLEHAAPFVGRLDRQDREMLLADALGALWELRNSIKESKDILLTWELALSTAARKRPTWKIYFSNCGGEPKIVKGSWLGKQ